jgi:hypothetical protein
MPTALRGHVTDELTLMPTHGCGHGTQRSTFFLLLSRPFASFAVRFFL